MVLWLVLVGFLAQKFFRAKEYILFETQLQIQPSMTQLAQMILSKPLFIIVFWMYPSRDDEMAEEAFEWCFGWPCIFIEVASHLSNISNHFLLSQ
jgi:hypothetical protein